MLPASLGCVVFLFCLSSSCVPYVASFSRLCCVGTQDEEKQKHNTTQPREAGNIGYTRTKKNKNTTQHNQEKLATKGTQDEEKQN
jgi:hypothetical protein